MREYGFRLSQYAQERQDSSQTQDFGEGRQDHQDQQDRQLLFAARAQMRPESPHQLLDGHDRSSLVAAGSWSASLCNCSISRFRASYSRILIFRKSRVSSALAAIPAGVSKYAYPSLLSLLRKFCILI